jgi:hypothetical protein
MGSWPSCFVGTSAIELSVNVNGDETSKRQGRTPASCDLFPCCATLTAHAARSVPCANVEFRPATQRFVCPMEVSAAGASRFSKTNPTKNAYSKTQQANRIRYILVVGVFLKQIC